MKKYIIIIFEGEKEYYFNGLKPSITHSSIIKTENVNEVTTTFSGGTLYTIGTYLQMLTEKYPQYRYEIKALEDIY